jgi:competence protein ComEC
MSELLIANDTDSFSFSDRIYYRPLIPLLLAFVAGIAVADQLPERLIWLAVAGILISGSIIIYAVNRHKNAKFFPLILFFCLGYYSLTPWLPAFFPQDHANVYVNDPFKWEISGIIDAPPLPQDYRTVCIIDRIQLSRPSKKETTVSVKGKIRAIIYGDSRTLSIGDRLTFESKIRPFTNFKNPGGFDYIRYMAFKRIWGNAYTSYKKVAIQPSANNVKKYLFTLRQKISTLINQSSDGDANAILHALIIGNRQHISKPLGSAFNRAGISHLLAISGLHIGIVASFTFFLSTWMLSQFKPMLRHAWTRKGAALLSLIPILFYGIIAGMTPSTQRAVIMVSVFLLTFLLEREHDLINTISVAALIILIIYPPSLFSISFQLSFAAVLAIIYGTSKILPVRKKPVTITAYFLKTIVTFCIVSGLAIIGTAPLTMFYFNQISLMGILSNLIFIPLIGFTIVPLALFSVFVLLPINSSAGFWGLKICDFILTFSIKWIYRIADLPFAAVKTITPSFIEISCIYALLGSVLYLFFSYTKKILNNETQSKIRTKKKLSQDAHNKPGLSRPLRAINALNGMMPCRLIKDPGEKLSGRQWASILTGITLFILSADIYYWVDKRWGKEDLTVSIIDVGQGNAALIEMPGGKCALIDGGGYSNNEIFDIGAKVIAPFLWQKKIKTIETVILTHYDSDHLNGLIFVLKHFNVKQVFANHEPATCFKNKGFNQIIADKQIPYPPYNDFPKKLNINGVIIKILYPMVHFADLVANDAWRDSNNNSMVIQVNFKNQSILFPGDIMKKAEEEIIALNDNLRSTIMLAPHHGSSSSSTPGFLKYVNPEYIVISSGRQNRFGFPEQDVLSRYKRNQIKTYRTDEDGCVSISIDGDQLNLAPMIGEKIWIDY